MQSIVDAGIMTHELASRVPIHVAGTSGRTTFGTRYARKSAKCDLYIYTSGNVIICDHCALSDEGESVTFDERGKMADHILKHDLANHQIPTGLIATLIEEIKLKGEKINA